MTVSDYHFCVEEQVFHTHGLAIHSKRWNKGAKHQVLAIHGWLDNANSFDLLAPYLPDCDIVALDSAGHGKSDFRSADSSYLIWSEVGEIFDIADQLGWQQFHLIGHSRGAGITSMCAGTFPERIRKLVIIEGGIPTPSKPQDVAINLAKHILDDKKRSGTKGTLFPDRETALNARANGFTKVSLDTAKILAERSLRKDTDGFRWHADARLKVISSLKLTHQQIDAFFKEIRCPCLSIEGKQGILNEMPFTNAHLSHIRHLKRVEFDGGHHLHMEDATRSCSKLIQKFFAEDA